jgi:N-acylneuraminate cytidylyltransferase
VTSRLAIVPARGGSKRIPDKNVRSFRGQPIISYVLSAARNSELFDHIHVSTDSDKIAGVATELGYPPSFMRPGELANDQTPLMPVLRYVATTFAASGKHYDEIWLLMACAPLLEAQDLIGAAELFAMSGSTNPVLSVARYPSPIEWAFRRSPQGNLTPVQPQMLGVRSQDMEISFYDAGSFCVFPAKTILGMGSNILHCSEYLGYELPRHKAIDIDDISDFQFAEIVFSALYVQDYETS